MAKALLLRGARALLASGKSRPRALRAVTAADHGPDGVGYVEAAGNWVRGWLQGGGRGPRGQLRLASGRRAARRRAKAHKPALGVTRSAIVELCMAGHSLNHVVHVEGSEKGRAAIADDVTHRTVDCAPGYVVNSCAVAPICGSRDVKPLCPAGAGQRVHVHHCSQAHTPPQRCCHSSSSYMRQHRFRANTRAPAFASCGASRRCRGATRTRPSATDA